MTLVHVTQQSWVENTFDPRPAHKWRPMSKDDREGRGSEEGLT